jgi:hypothetical protein
MQSSAEIDFLREKFNFFRKENPKNNASLSCYSMPLSTLICLETTTDIDQLKYIHLSSMPEIIATMT